VAKNTVSGGNPVEPIHGFDGLTTGEVIQSSVLVKEGTDTPLRSHTTRGLAVDTSGTGLLSSRHVISTAGTPTALNGGSSVPCKSVCVTALPTNTQNISIGASNVDAASATLTGIPLAPGEKVALDVSDVNVVFVDVLGDGHGVAYAVIT
jgi:hypothetical protein